MSTDKKTVIISGGSGYLGSALIARLIDDGYSVLIIDREPNGVIATSDICYKFADISNGDAVKKIAAEFKTEHRVVVAIIHAASMSLVRKPVLSLSEEDFLQQVMVSMYGAFHLFKYFSEFLSEDGALIGITTSAILPGAVHSKTGSYVTAKYGLQGLLRSLSVETPFRIYSVAPSFMPGGLNNDLPETVRNLIVEKSVPGNVTNADEAARAIVAVVNDREKKWNAKTIVLPAFSVIPL